MQILMLTDGPSACLDALYRINDENGLGLVFSCHQLPKFGDKLFVQFASDYPKMPMIAIIKDTPVLIKIDNRTVIKSSLNWQALTRRIVTAGRKSELILQACKINDTMTVLDGTAGLGHDGLILASTGARLTLCESNPVLAMLLFYEYQLMMTHKNWQGLLSGIQIVHGDTAMLGGCYDCVYLDPMFPKDSYKAKVNKQMQVLHDLVAPPPLDDEIKLFGHAKSLLATTGKLIIKRPILAPYFAGQLPQQSVKNDVLRFDRYEAH
ncbi:class I SAM-dependent methyltransferase [Moraxella marmotae]|uniref:class I SAM-dependent methyltransferase n=1 Tax=Moraxella marmotae TaxID=3344520 RepID=UPI0035F3E190